MEISVGGIGDGPQSSPEEKVSKTIEDIYNKYPNADLKDHLFPKFISMLENEKYDRAIVDNLLKIPDGYFAKTLGIKNKNDLNIIFSYLKKEAGIEEEPASPAPRGSSIFTPSKPLMARALPVTSRASAGTKDYPPVIDPGPPPGVDPKDPNYLANLNNLKANLQRQRTNYIAILREKIKHSTISEIFDWKKEFQQLINKDLSKGGSSYDALVKGMKYEEGSTQLTQMINFLKQGASFYPPVDDRILNFLNGLNEGVVPGGPPGLLAWMQGGGSLGSRTEGEINFGNALKALIKPGMSDDEIEKTLNKFMNAQGADNIFTKYGIDPKNFPIFAAMLPGIHIKLPIPTDMENACIQSFKFPKNIGDNIRALLGQSKNFEGFTALVKESKLFSGLTGEQLSLLQELSGNQPKNTSYKPLLDNGSALFTYANKSGVSDSQVFIQVILKPNTGPYVGRQCFVQFNRDGTFTYVPVEQAGDPKKFAYPLSFFNRSADGKAASLYLPAGDGGRLYTSIGQPLTFGSDGKGGIIHPDPHRIGDFNNAIRWDKTEYTISPVQHNGMIFLNATAVDNVTLPVIVSVTRKDGSVHQGGLTQSVFDTLQEKLAKYPPWSNLIQGNTILSVMDGASTKSIFPPDFFMKPQTYPFSQPPITQSKSWMQAFIERYQNTPLQIRTNDSRIEVPPGSNKFIDDGKGIWRSTIDPNTRKMVFSRVPPCIYNGVEVKVDLTMPANAKDLLAGNGDWGFYDLNKMNDALYEKGLIRGGTRDKEGHWTPPLSDDQIRSVCFDPKNSNVTINGKSLPQLYAEMKIGTNLARDISVAVSTNTLGAKSDQVLTNRLCQLAQDVDPKTNKPQYSELQDLIKPPRELKNGNWVPPLKWEEILSNVSKLPGSVKDGPTGLMAMYNTYKSLHDQGIDEAPICQDTFKGTYQTAFAYNPNAPEMQFIDPVAGTIAAHAIKQPGHDKDPYGDIYVGSYTDSTGHEGAASAYPTEYQSGAIILGGLGASGNSYTT
jgi:hypothetical protein